MHKFLFSLLVHISLALGCLTSQERFQSKLGLNPIESNSAYKVIEHNNRFYIGGNYFDEIVGRWTAFYGIYELKGDLIKVLTERVDTMPANDIGRKILVDSAGLYHIGLYNSHSKLLHYNFASDSVWVNFTFDRISNNFTPVHAMFSQNKDKLILTGFDIANDENSSTQIVLRSIQDTIVREYRDNPQNQFRERSWSGALDSNGDIIVLGRRTNPNGATESFILKLTEDMELIYSTRDGPDRLNFASRPGFCLDSEDNIIIPAATVVNDSAVQTVVKLNPQGKVLWEKHLDKNNFNSNNIGRWNSVIAAHNNTGYIIAGSEAYHLSESVDTFIVKTALAKLSNEGEELWYRTYTFRTGERVIEQLFDIIKTSDGGYLAVGNSSLPDAEDGELPRTQSILLKTDVDGWVDFTDGTELSIDENEKIVITPNPVIDKLYITQSEDILIEISVYTNSGKKIESFISTDRNHTIVLNTADYSPGLYYIKVADIKGRKISSKKFFKL